MTTALHYPAQYWPDLITSTVNSVTNLSTTKGVEYSGETNRLLNFVRNAAALDVEPELVWAVYAGKHWDAIQTYCKDMNVGLVRTRSEPIEGRFVIGAPLASNRGTLRRSTFPVSLFSNSAWVLAVIT